MALDIQQLLKDIHTDNPNHLPPVHLWQPNVSGVMDLVIDKHQHWFHEGTAFQRQSLVKLLASVMRKEAEHYFLVTPQEKMQITVEDVPFSVISILQSPDDPTLSVAITNTEERIKLDAFCDWELRDFDGNAIPYIKVRDELWARMSRPVYYQLIETASVDEEAGQVCFISAGISFLLGQLEDDS